MGGVNPCPCCGQDVARPAVLFYEGSHIVALGDRAVEIGGLQRKAIFRSMFDAWPRVVTLEKMIGLLWPNPADESENPAQYIRVSMALLRKEIAPLGIVVRCERAIGYRLEFPRGVATLRPKMKAA